jgi:hypothetical protein
MARKKIITLDGGDVGLDLVDLRKAGGEAELGNRWVEHWRQASKTRKHVYVWCSLLLSLMTGGGYIVLLIAVYAWVVYRHHQRKSLKRRQVRRYTIDEVIEEWNRSQLEIMRRFPGS